MMKYAELLLLLLLLDMILILLLLEYHSLVGNHGRTENDLGGSGREAGAAVDLCGT